MDVDYPLWAHDEQVHTGGTPNFILGHKVLDGPDESGFLCRVIGGTKAASSTGFGRHPERPVRRMKWQTASRSAASLQLERRTDEYDT